MAETLSPAIPDEWAQFKDAPIAADDWSQFQDAPVAEDWSQFQDAPPAQNPLSTAARSAALGPGNRTMKIVEGVGTWFENLSDVANKAVPGLGDVLDYAPQSALFQKLKPVAAEISQSAQEFYKPDTELNPKAATVGGALGDVVGMVPMALTGGTPLVLGSAVASGYGEGSKTAEDLGVQNPVGRMAMGAAFAGAEAGVERLGGLGGGPLKAGARQIVESLGKSTLKTIGSETVEEPVTGMLQDAASAVAAKAVEDPNNPGFTTTGVPLATYDPTSADYWNRRGMEALGGAVGGTLFAGVGALGRRMGQPEAAPPPLPVPAAGMPRVEVGGVTYEFDPNEITADAVQTLAASGGLQEFIDQGMVRDANAPFMPPPLPPDAGGNGVVDPGNVGNAPVAPVVAPGPSVVEARQTLGDTGNVGAAFAGASTVGRAGVAPLPRNPDGDLDLLNYLNENPIRAPRRGTETAGSGEYDWREAGDFPKEYRSRIMQEGAPNIDQRAQEAFDMGLISEPTSEALAAGVRETIAARQERARQLRQVQRQTNAGEAAQVAFEQTQATLGGRGVAVDLDALSPGDALTMGGQRVTVAAIDFDEDGRTTRAVLNTPAGQVRVTPEMDVRMDPVVNESLTPAPRDLADINAELELAAQGFSNTDVVGRRPDGSTVIFGELVGLAAEAVRAGTRFAKWAADMVRQFGESVRAYLAGAWQAARKGSQRGSLDIGGSVLSMASDSGAAQNAEPSTGGLTESEDYRMMHRPRDDGPRAHDLLEGEVAPRDIYQHPEWYASDPDAPEYKETMRQIRAVRGKPNGTLTIYRAAPKGAKMRAGDWVSLSKTYAKQHGILDDNPENDMPVIAMKVPAAHVRWDGNDWNEFGYYPPESSRAESGAGFSNTQVVGKRNDGSTVVFAELVGLAERAVRAGVNFAQWSAQMVRELGTAVRRYLEGAWQAARKTSEVGAINLGARISAREPTMAEAMAGQTRESQFGERVQADPRLSGDLRAALPSVFAVQSQQEAMNAAAAVIREVGLEGALAEFSNNANLPMPVRIAGLMQVALQADARAALARRQDNPAAMVAADRMVEMAIEAKGNLEVIGNETGRNLAMFNTWARMSPDGQLRRLDMKLEKAGKNQVRGDIGTEAAEVSKAVEEAMDEQVNEMANAIDALLEEEAGRLPEPVNLQTGESLLSRALGKAERFSRWIAESSALQKMADAAGSAIEAMKGKLFADPLLLTPMGRAVLQTTRTLLLQGQKLAAAVADAIAVVRTRLNDTSIQDVDLARAVTKAITAEVIKPIMRKLAFDPAYNKKEAVKDLLAIGVGIMEAGRLADALIAKKPKIAKTAQAKVREKVMRRLSDKPRARSRKQKLPGVIDTMMQAVGAGFATEKAFLEAWDKKFGLPKLGAADRKRLRDMAARLNLLPEGILRQEKAVEFLNEVALIEGVPASDMILGAWYANILSGMSTQAVNIWGNGLMLAFRSLAVGAGSPLEFGKLLGGMAAGFKPGMREAVNVLKTGTLMKTLKMDDTNARPALEQLMAQGGPKSAGQWLAYVMSLGGLTRFVFRAMGAMDAVFWYTAQEGMAHVAVARALRKGQGLKPGTVAFNAEFVRQLGGDEKQMLVDIDQARQELIAAGAPVVNASLMRRAWEIRQQRRRLDVQDASVRWADRMVLQNKPEGVGEVISFIIGKLQQWRPLGVPVFVPLVPFNRIIANLFESTLDFTGVGILRGMLGSHLSQVANKDRRMFDTVERRERFFAGVLGLSVGGAMLAAAMAVKDDDDDEVPFMVYGFGPPDKARRDLMPKGWRPFVMKVGKNYVSFAESPIGPLLGAVGGFMDRVRYGAVDNKTMIERGVLAFLSALGASSSMGALSSLKEATEVYSGQGSTQAIKRQALSPVPGFIPAQGMMRDVAMLFDDNKISDESIYGALVRDVPVLKSQGRPTLNVLGEPVKIEGLPVVRRFMTGQRVDDNIKFIQTHRLKISAIPTTVDIDQYLSARDKRIFGLDDTDQRRALGMVAVENGVMTPDQKYKFVKRQGEMIRESLGRLRKEFTGPTTPEMQKRLQNRVEAATRAAREVANREIVSDIQ